ncbi:MAG TPA: UDP-N-acetylmuramoyl-L-alanine--D-glutamate ligase [Alphaproteobacteria bacterium]|nr:UDP-N-acetylmuramoyl-L-alanine--D-glutamate ligase [Alphaproteobacteria bacterium]
MDSKLGFKNTVLVLGLGLTGVAVANDLAKRGVKVLAWDDKEDSRKIPLEKGARLADRAQIDALLADDCPDWKSFDAVIKSPGIPMASKLVRNALAANVKVMGDLDLLWRREQARGAHTKFIGITGTNGKSTTTALVGHLLRNAGFAVAVGGNIGEPALTLPELPEGGIYVLEMSSFQLETLSELQADGCLLLNLTADHLDRHGDMHAYLGAKLRLFEHAKPGAVRVLGVDQEPLRKVASQGGYTTVSVAGQLASYTVEIEGEHPGELWRGDKLIGDTSVFERLPGAHNWQNIACAYALLKGMNEGKGLLSNGEFFTGVQTFMGLPHRLERVRDIGNVGFINDSKATNGDSVVPALKSFADIFWICGGRPKSDGLEAVIEAGVLGTVRAAFTIGEAGHAFAMALRGQGVQAYECTTLEKAVRDAYTAAAQSGHEKPVVLLSPACASYDQFRNYEQRGEAFTKIVKGLK